MKKPDILTILGEDNDKNRSMCRIIQDWFKNNTNITIKYSLVKESEFKDDELRNRYDMVLINNDADILNKATFYSSFQSYLTGDQVKLLKKAGDDKKNDSYGELEESLFNDYDILPLVFYNENIAISSKVSQLNLDGNGNIDFTTIK